MWFGLQKERMILDKIVFSVEQHLQHVLLREPNLTLAKTIDICRSYEILVQSALELQQASGQHQVHAISDQTRKHGRNCSTSTVQPKCHFCVNTTKKAKLFAQLTVVSVPTAKDEITSKQSARSLLCTN